MKVHIQQLAIDGQESFIARTYGTPVFETPYHTHKEYELMLVRKGAGAAFIGDYVGEFRAGEVYLHGKNLPHWFRKREDIRFASSMVVQFSENSFGQDFFEIPEMEDIKHLLDRSQRGIRCMGKLRAKLERQLLKIEKLTGYVKMRALLDMLNDISNSSDIEYVSNLDSSHYSSSDNPIINEVIQFSMENYRRKIYLQELAELTNKSISSFSHYFRRTTKLTYIQFLTQLRISNACRLLKETDLSVTEICYQSGFQNWANFSKHFKTNCGMSPSKYRHFYLNN